MIMFINGSSGGHVGPALSKRFSEVVGSKQVSCSSLLSLGGV